MINERAHTWHNITTNTVQSWIGRLAITSAMEKAFFVNSDGEIVGQIYDFNVSSSNSPFEFGFGFELPGTDFEVSYSLHLYLSDTKSDAINTLPAPACQFDISAKGPAEPVITVERYGDASCQYETIAGVGEDYMISHNDDPFYGDL